MMTYAKQRTIVMLCIALTLSACKTVGPDYARPDAALPSQYTEQVVNQPPSLLGINAAWWRSYQDPVLNGLIEQALINNTTIQLAVARIQEVDAYAKQVGALSLPSVDFSTNGKRQRVTESGQFPVFGANPRNNYQFELTTSFEIDFWGKLVRAKESARAQMLASRYGKEIAVLSLTSLLTQHYLTVRSVESQQQIVKDSLRSREESLALTKRRLEGGVSSALDVHQAEVAAANLKAQLAELSRQRSIALHQLATLTGELDLSLNTDALASLPVPPVPPSGLPSSLLENRPDIKQAEALMIAANADIGYAKSALYPSISITAGLGGESLELKDVIKSASRIWTGGIGLTLPIFNAGKLEAKVDEVTAKQRQTLIQYEDSVRNAFREVNDALVNLRQHTTSEQALAEAEVAAEKAVKISENRYETGYSTYLEVLDSQRVYNEVALNAIIKRQARLSATVELYRALGGGWQDQYSSHAALQE
jgi:multidrug efflux system outer membrane protein